MKTNPLDHIKIASPCSADWDGMRGDDKKRFCSLCKLNVYNLSEMTKREAEALVFEMEGKMCVKFYKRADGTVITQDCPVGLAKIKQRISRVATAAAGLVFGIIGGIWGTALVNLETPQFSEIAQPETQEHFEPEPQEFEEVYVGRPETRGNDSGNAIDFGAISNGPEVMDILWLFSERYPKK